MHFQYFLHKKMEATGLEPATPTLSRWFYVQINHYLPINKSFIFQGLSFVYQWLEISLDLLYLILFKLHYFIFLTIKIIFTVKFTVKFIIYIYISRTPYMYLCHALKVHYLNLCYMYLLSILLYLHLLH